MVSGEVQRFFPDLRGTIYMNTASLAPGCRPAVDALTAAAADWARGRLNWLEAEHAGEEARTLFARLINAPVDCVALVPAASAVAGLVAAHLPQRFPQGGNILVGAEEFTSSLFPWRLLEARGFEVRALPTEGGRVAEQAFEAAADHATRLIAVSAVQSATGYRADLARLRAVADRCGALLYVDAAQAAGALPLDITAPRIDALAAPSHKFLLGTRGMGYGYFAPALRDALDPVWAGWKAASEPLASFYGPKMALSATASRFDMSLAWINALAERESMRVLHDLGPEQVQAHNLGIAAHLRRCLKTVGVPFLDHGPERGSTIFACAPRGDFVVERLKEAGVVATARAGHVRLSLHLYNTVAQVEQVAALLGGARRKRVSPMTSQARAEADELSRVLNAAARAALAFRQELPDGLQKPAANYAVMREAFDGPLPEWPVEDGQAVIEDLAARAAPGLHASAGPRFFGWVIGASHPVGVAADWLTSAWGQNAGNHEAAPSAAAAEAAAARWLLELLSLPADCSVGFVTGATVANLVCLAAARSAVLRRADWNAEADGLEGAPPIRVLIGDDAHTTIFLALQVLGFGHRRLVRIATDSAGRIRADALATALAESDGPSIVVAQAGQINTGAFDPFPAISAAVARHPRAWLHVDGAFGLWARAAPDRAHLAQGVELADSWATDGHKWLQTPYDCGYAIVRDAEAHRRAMTAAASFLPPVAEGERDPSHYVPELSRRARGFATWALIQALGRHGIAGMVERHCALARRFAAALTAEPGVAVLNEVELNQVVIRFGAGEDVEQGNALTREVIARVQRDGVCFAGGARWRGLWVMRLSVISWPTTEADVDLAARAIIGSWRATAKEVGV